MRTITPLTPMTKQAKQVRRGTFKPASSFSIAIVVQLFVLALNFLVFQAFIA